MILVEKITLFHPPLSLHDSCNYARFALSESRGGIEEKRNVNFTYLLSGGYTKSRNATGTRALSPELQPTRVATGGEYELARGVEREGAGVVEAEDRFGSVGARLFDASSRGPHRGFIIRGLMRDILRERCARSARCRIIV